MSLFKKKSKVPVCDGINHTWGDCDQTTTIRGPDCLAEYWTEFWRISYCLGCNAEEKEKIKEERLKPFYSEGIV